VRRFTLPVRVTAIAVGHLGMKLALFIRGLTRAGELTARLRIATEVVLLSAVAVTATAAASAPASAPTTTFATRPVLRRAIARFEGRRCIARNCNAAVGGRGGYNGNGIRIGGSLLLTLAFALALTLCLALGVTLRIALARLIVSLTLAWRVTSRVTRRLRGAPVATMLATCASARLALTIASAVLVTIPVASVRAAITIASAVTVATTMSGTVAVAAMAGTIPVAITGAITMAVTTRLAAGRRRFGGGGSIRGLAGE